MNETYAATPRWLEGGHKKDSSMLKYMPLPISLFFMAGCASEPMPEEKSAMANPASIYCAQQGGRVEVRDEANGQAGYCHLSDGSITEEWALFRAAEADRKAP